jgi:hypothetical protein
MSPILPTRLEPNEERSESLLMTPERFSRVWLQGSTCHRHQRTIHWVSEDNRFVLMKHHGHTEYVNRVSGSQHCETFYALYDLLKPLPGALGNPSTWKVKGRWLKSHEGELSRLVAELRATHAKDERG